MERDGPLEQLSPEADLNQRNKAGIDRSIDNRAGVVIVTLKLFKLQRSRVMG